MRERRFSADVSHQLRTPLAAVQLRLEAARDSPTPAAVDKALDDLGRLEQTVVHLIAHARGVVPADATTRLDDAIRRAEARWAERVRAAGRQLVVSPGSSFTCRGADGSIDQILGRERGVARPWQDQRDPPSYRRWWRDRRDRRRFARRSRRRRATLRTWPRRGNGYWALPRTLDFRGNRCQADIDEPSAHHIHTYRSVGRHRTPKPGTAVKPNPDGADDLSL